MAFKIKKKNAFESMNLTPLIDVLFFLLTFFLVSSQYDRLDSALPVQLPSAASAMPMTAEPTELVVNVDGAGQYMILGERMTLDKVESTLKRAVVDNPINQVVVIRGDRNVAFQAVVSVMDLCTKLKVPTYKISTESKVGS